MVICNPIDDLQPWNRNKGIQNHVEPKDAEPFKSRQTATFPKELHYNIVLFLAAFKPDKEFRKL